VTERLGDGDQRYPISRIGAVRRVFELTTRDGVHVQLFLAPNDAGGECWAVTHDLSADTDPEDFGYACVASQPGIPTRHDGVGVVPTDSDHPGPPILFGLTLGGFELPAGTRLVRVVGPGLDETVRTRTAEGWAVELPDGTHDATYRVDFVGREGQVLDRVTERVD
jgi:hypothetical protein